MTDIPTPAADIAENDYYAPNQQVVRPDGSGPAEEGEGGSTQQPETEPQEQTPAPAARARKATS